VENPFDCREVLIRQPARLIGGHASYEIFDTERRLLAVASETEGRSRLETLTGLVPGTRVLAVRTAAGEPLLTLVKRDSDWAADLTDPAGQPIGRIRIGDTRRTYTLLDGHGQVLGEAAGDLAVKNFSVTGAEGARIARVRKTWAGLRKELLTSADHYRVEFAGSPPGPVRLLTVMMTIVLDLARYGPD
jgi:Scramblase